MISAKRSFEWGRTSFCLSCIVRAPIFVLVEEETMGDGDVVADRCLRPGEGTSQYPRVECGDGPDYAKGYISEMPCGFFFRQKLAVRREKDADAPGRVALEERAT